MSSSFSAYRNPNTNRQNSGNDDGSKDLKSNIRESRWIQPEQWQSPEVEQKFEKGAIDFSEVLGILQQLGIKVQKFELDKILETHDKNKDRKLSKEEFEALYLKLLAEKDPGTTWNKNVRSMAAGVDRFVTRKSVSDDIDSNSSTVEKQQDAKMHSYIKSALLKQK
ncbi:unnamed protein product [Rotaria sp. Silwood2]|nr:unnamed protein product [Rotaria sp. Silwood2]